MTDQIRNVGVSDGEPNLERLRMLMHGYENNYPKHLAEQFPRIVNNLVMLWDTPYEMTVYLEKLLITDRPNRQGFPRAVASEIFTLSRIYDEVHSNSGNTNNVWNSFSSRPN